MSGGPRWNMFGGASGGPSAPSWMWVCYGLAGAGALALMAAGAGLGGFTKQVEVRVAGYVGLFLVLTDRRTAAR